MSVGERQKLSILTALGHRPDLLVLDEPVASLDPVARRLFLEELVEVAADGRRAVVFSSHIVSDIERLANRIWILKNGRLEWQGDLDSLKESIVRVHLHATTQLPAALDIPNALSVRRETRHAVAVVRDWTQEFQERLARDSRASVQVEALPLEEIFLELHR
jgi:ABC-2 type transport system ATP-binding protein